MLSFLHARCLRVYSYAQALKVGKDIDAGPAVIVITNDVHYCTQFDVGLKDVFVFKGNLTIGYPV